MATSESDGGCPYPYSACNTADRGLPRDAWEADLVTGDTNGGSLSNIHGTFRGFRVGSFCLVYAGSVQRFGKLFD